MRENERYQGTSPPSKPDADSNSVRCKEEGSNFTLLTPPEHCMGGEEGVVWGWKNLVNLYFEAVFTLIQEINKNVTKRELYR